ncbi:MAG: ATPase, T2SS/T4P/T4SS family [Opitutales bacterium]
MQASSELSYGLRRTLLIKVLSKPQPTAEDVQAVIELTSSKIVELLHAQSMTFYLLDDEEITFRHVYYSPTLWENAPDKEAQFNAQAEKLLKIRLPMGKGIVGKVISTGQPLFFFQGDGSGNEMISLSDAAGFDIMAMATVPLIAAGRVIGAVQMLNKEPDADTQIFEEEDLSVLREVAEYAAPLIQRMMNPEYALSDQDTAKFVARFTDTPLLATRDEVDIDDKLMEVTGAEVVRRTKILPFKRISPTAVEVLMPNPLDYQMRESFTATTEMHIEEVYVAPASLIDQLLNEFFPEKPEEQSHTDSAEIHKLADALGDEFSVDEDTEEGGGLDDEESAPIIQLANRVIEDAYVSGASDIHIEPQETELIVRYRVDGVCHEKLKLPAKLAGSLVARLKVMSELDIAEKRLPQDGRIVFKKFTKKNIDIDLRVATGPMNFGEKVVMRILDKSKSALPITALGFSEENLTRYRACIQQPYGMILHCGPTGSGKSMTLFSALREIATPDINIQTAEDPIEYTIPGINQMQMKKEIGLTFARALRAYLRMDPDIILVGEIRDQETAEIAVEAALTGHLLLSTLHTNDAPSTVARFTDMDIEPFMISSSMLVVCAQRLIRRVCKDCRQLYTPQDNEAEILERAIGWVGECYKASEKGCPKCGGSGMKGRVGIHELMQNNEDLTKAINEGRETAELKRIAMASGMKTLHQDSMLKVKEHLSTVLEGISNVPPDMIRLEDQ